MRGDPVVGLVEPLLLLARGTLQYAELTDHERLAQLQTGGIEAGIDLTEAAPLVARTEGGEVVAVAADPVDVPRPRVVRQRFPVRQGRGVRAPDPHGVAGAGGGEDVVDPLPGPLVA